jgi:hypothetical protein
MNLRALALTACLIVCGPVQASAGLTSVGVDPGQTNNPQADPTLAQVAAAQNTAATAANAVPGTVVVPVAGAPGAQAGAAGGAGTAGSGPGGAAAGSAAAAPAPRIVVPPPPPDPATLPVSVIRPLSKTQESATPSGASVAAAPETALAPKSGDEVQPGATNTKPRSGLPVPSARTLSARAGSPPAPSRAEAAARATPEPEVPADGSSSSVIFYSGTGLAAAIVLLSLGAFFRGGGADAAKPRSL